MIYLIEKFLKYFFGDRQLKGWHRSLRRNTCAAAIMASVISNSNSIIINKRQNLLIK